MGLGPYTTLVRRNLASTVLPTVKLYSHLNSKTSGFACLPTGPFELQKKYAGILRDFAAIRAISHGKALHAHIIKTIPRLDLFLFNSLANMYSKCGSMQDACMVFGEMPQPDVVSWNTIVEGYFLSGLPSIAFSCLRKMLCHGVAPDEFSFTSMLKSFVGCQDLMKGLMVHCVIIKYGLGCSAFVANGLVEFYAKIDLLGLAMKVFDGLEVKDIVLVSIVIQLLAEAGECSDAFMIFKNHVMGGFMLPTRATFVNLLSALDGHGFPRQGLQVHCLIIKFGFEADGAVENSIVRIYANRGRTDDALDLLIFSGSRNVISWTTLIGGYGDLGQLEDAIYAFDWIRHEAQMLDNILLACILNVAASSESLRLGTQLHSLIVQYGFNSDPCITNSLINMYAKCRSIGASRIFQQNSDYVDVLSCTALISGYVHNGLSVEALYIFHEMIKGGINPDSVTCISVLAGCIDIEAITQGEQIHAFVIKSGYETDISVQTALVSLYSACGSLDETVKLFRMMKRHDVVSWTALISACVKHGYSEEALVMFARMLQDGIIPNDFTLSTALTASTHLTSIKSGTSVHAFLVKIGLKEDKFVGSALIDMYSKCGSIESAASCFKESSSRNDLCMWNALLAGHAQHGNVMELLNAFKDMHDHAVKPDNVTFLALLSGCSHVGLIDDMIHFYNMMQDRYGIRPMMEHCNCVVDALRRAGLFKEAANFIQGMSIEPSPEVLRSLISSCIAYGLVHLGLSAAAKMVVLGQSDSSMYILLSNLYAVEERWIESRKIREAMESDRVTIKKVGKSWLAC